jgi:hypothetical protein
MVLFKWRTLPFLEGILEIVSELVPELLPFEFDELNEDEP